MAAWKNADDPPADQSVVVLDVENYGYLTGYYDLDRNVYRLKNVGKGMFVDVPADGRVKRWRDIGGV